MIFQISDCVYDGCCRRRMQGDQFHCIFHASDNDEKAKNFNEAFEVEFERQGREEKTYDFYGFVFPGEISFEGRVFKKDASFINATFNGNAEFWDAKFLGDVTFVNAKFSRWADFSSTQFKKKAEFREVCFNWNSRFSYAKFNGKTEFNGSKFYANSSFNSTHFSNFAAFNNTKFFQAINFDNAQFYAIADFSCVYFDDHNSLNLFDTYFYDIYGLFEYIEANRRKFKYPDRTDFLPNGIRPTLGERASDHYPIIKRKIQDDKYLIDFKKRHPLWHSLWWIFADCGRSLTRWILWSLFFAFYFAVNFVLIDFSFSDAFKFGSELIDQSFHSYLYYSVVTFTTLGFGDITPIIPIAQKWVMAEVIAGYVMLGGLISILANKLARRS